jgi:uncharacterized protein (TIGR00369 family)
LSSRERQRLVCWSDPLALADAGRSMTGMQYLTAIRDARLPHPPLAQLIGFTFDEAAEGLVVLSMAAAEEHYNAVGSLHGGVVAALLDTAMGCAVHSRLPVGRGYTTLEIKVNYVARLTEAAGRLRAEGVVIHLGSRIATAEGRLFDASGRLCAHGLTTCLLLDASPARQ